MSELTKRQMLVGTAGLAATATFSTPSILRAAEPVAVSCATATPGLTVVFYDYIRDNKLDAKHGIKLGEPVLNSSIGTLFNDFVAGSSDLIIASWDPVLTRYQAGVPCQLLCTLMTADMIGVVAVKGGPKSAAELKGKVIAAPQQSGVYRMTRALILDLEGLDIETAAKVQNADNPAQGVTLVIADRADAAVAWEPMITAGMKRRPDLEVIYSAGGAFREKTELDLPYFCVNARREILASAPDMSKRLNAMFAECIAAIEANSDGIAERYAARTLIDAETVKTAKTAGRLRFKYTAASDPMTQKTLSVASEILVRRGVLTRAVEAGFFAA